jgi:hypothetical protein
MKQIGLFDICERNHGGNENSRDAFRSVVGSAGELRRRVSDYIRSRGALGATCDEIEMALGISHQTASARCSELKKLGQIREIGKRKTRTGRNAATLASTQGRCNFWENE